MIFFNCITNTVITGVSLLLMLCYVLLKIKMKFTKKYLDNRLHKSDRWWCEYTKSYKYTWFLGAFVIVIIKNKICVLTHLSNEKILDINSEEKLNKLIEFVNHEE